jgi:putrescine transport system ATP-binding protein
VATFVGESNLFDGVLRVDGDRAWIDTGRHSFAVTAEAIRRAGLSNGDTAVLIVRPERVRFDDPAGEDGRVVEVDYLGGMRRYVIRLDAGGEDLIARVQSGSAHDMLRVDDRVVVGWAVEQAALVTAGR